MQPLRSDEQTLVLVDDGGRPTGHAPRPDCHRGDGLRHLAIQLCLFDGAGRVLLQERRSALWDRTWDLAGATHPLRLADGQDESLEEAAQRCLRDEWGIALALEERFAFDYFEREGEWCENEHCVLFTGVFDGTPRPDPRFAYGYRWAEVEELSAAIARDRAAYTPWARVALELLVENGLTS